MITSTQLNKIHTELTKHKKPTEYDHKGRPCYSVAIYGTPEEIEATWRKLLELDED